MSNIFISEVYIKLVALRINRYTRSSSQSQKGWWPLVYRQKRLAVSTICDLSFPPKPPGNSGCCRGNPSGNESVWTSIWQYAIDSSKMSSDWSHSTVDHDFMQRHQNVNIYLGGSSIESNTGPSCFKTSITVVPFRLYENLSEDCHLFTIYKRKYSNADKQFIELKCLYWKVNILGVRSIW